MKIILVRPPFIDIKFGPPIGLAYLNKVLKDKGHEVSIIDMNIEINKRFQDITAYNRDFVLPDNHPAVKYAYRKIEGYCENILSQKPEIVGFSLSYPTVKYGLEMAKRLSNFVRCIAGGPQATFNEQDLLDLGYFDTIVSGYGEEAVLEALNSRGIIYKALDPSKRYLPDYTGMTIDRYNGRLPVVTSRGCPNRCTFCTQHFPYLYHPIESVVQQIQNIPNIREVMYNDSIINVSAKRTERLFTELSKLKLKPPGHIFGMQIREGFKTYISKMAEAGVREARVGIESGSIHERTSMNKPEISNDLIAEFIKELTANKILTWAQFIFCYPDQTEKDRKETLDLMNRINDECDASYVKHFWYKFVVHHGRESFFRKEYGVIAHSPQNWKNVFYNPKKIKKLEKKYSKLIPENGKIYL